MTEKEIIEFIDECLSDYPSNLTRIEVLQKDLDVLRASTDVKAQHFSTITGKPKTSHGDPVFDYVSKIEKLEKEIERLERITMPITRMIQDLKSPYALNGSLNNDFIKILGLSYFGRNPLSVILASGNWSRATYFRKKKQLFELAQKYLGILPPTS